MHPARIRNALTFAALLALAPLAVAQSDGAAAYTTYCSSCHQANGAGIPGVFPPLAGHAADLYAAEGGRRYLADAIVFGLQGAITVDGVAYNGAMPSWFQLSDADIAAVLNHIVAGWDDVEAPEGFEPYAPEDVATSKRGALTPELVLQRRPDLGDAGDAGAAGALPDATFTIAQIDRARPTYERLCVECHGESFTGGLIGGPPLSGAVFLQRWGGRSVEALHTYTQTQMPQGFPNSLSSQQYADLVALILSVNGHEAGDVELPGDPEALREVGVRSP